MTDKEREVLARLVVLKELTEAAWEAAADGHWAMGYGRACEAVQTEAALCLIEWSGAIQSLESGRLQQARDHLATAWALAGNGGHEEEALCLVLDLMIFER